MSLVHQGLIARGEYLTDPTLPERVAWEAYGSGHRLVVLPPPSSSPTDRESTPFPDGSDTAAANPVDPPISPPVSAAGVSPEPVDDAPANPPMPAVLTIVAQLVPGQSWLYPDGRWTGPTKYVRRFTDIKLLCTGGATSHPRFTNDYAVAIANLNSIMARVEDSRNERNTFISGPDNHIRVRHPLFTVRHTWVLLFISTMLISTY